MNITNQIELWAGLEEGLPSSTGVWKPELRVLSSTGMDVMGWSLAFYDSH